MLRKDVFLDTLETLFPAFLIFWSKNPKKIQKLLKNGRILAFFDLLKLRFWPFLTLNQHFLTKKIRFRPRNINFNDPEPARSLINHQYSNLA